MKKKSCYGYLDLGVAIPAFECAVVLLLVKAGGWSWEDGISNYGVGYGDRLACPARRLCRPPAPEMSRRHCTYCLA
eukprot:2326565-Pyramimonas_sp.AAC.1